MLSSCVHHKNTYIQHETGCLAVLSHNKNEHITVLAVKKPSSVQNSLFNSADKLTNESILKKKKDKKQNKTLTIEYRVVNEWVISLTAS